MPTKSPPTFNCFRQEHPGPTRQRGIAGGSGDHVSELADHGKLLVTVERPCVGEYLHPDVIAVSFDVRERAVREVVNERRVVLAEHRDVRNLFDLHQRGGQVTREGLRIREHTARGIDVDHRHWMTPLTYLG